MFLQEAVTPVGRPPVMRRVALDFHSPEAPSPPQSVRGGGAAAMAPEGNSSARQLRSPILPDGRLGAPAGGEVPAAAWSHVPRSASAGGLRRSFLLHAFSSPLRCASHCSAPLRSHDAVPSRLGGVHMRSCVAAHC